MKKCLTVDEVSRELGISQRHVYEMIRAGLLTAYDISISGRCGPHSIRVSVVSIQEFKMTRKITPDQVIL